LYLAGLAGFWDGIGALLIAVAAAAPSLAVAAISVLTVASVFLTMRAIRRLDRRIAGATSAKKSMMSSEYIAMATM
jgi:membrane protein implicated in regulation of membrane protease activity